MPMNMSYCRFSNTLEALHECEDTLDEKGGISDLSPSEQEAARDLILLCERMAKEWGYIGA